jgi:two-component system, LuxR family, sensor kinase FixL
MDRDAPRFEPVHGLIFVAAYVALDWVSFVYEFSPLGFTPWNPHTGLALAFLLRSSPVACVWLLPATFLADLIVRDWPGSPVLAVGSSFILSAVYAGAALLLRHRSDFRSGLDVLHDVVRLFAIGIAAALLGAVLYAGFYANADLLPWADFPAASYRHAVGDIIGIAVATPLLLRFPRPAGVAYPPVDGREVLAQIASIGLVLWIVFLPETDEFKFFYLLFLPVIWASVRHGFDGAVIAVALTQLGLIVSTHLRSLPSDIVVDLQTLMLALAFTGLLIGAVVSERQRAQNALHDSERRLRERQGELAQFARASAVGEMASSLAHELSQPLSATATYLSACSRLLASPHVELPSIREAIGKAEIQAKRAGRVLSGLRDFLYRGETHLDPFPASALVEAVAALARGEAERVGATLAVTDASAGARILVDRIQMEQALLNLIRNATEALSEAKKFPKEILVSIHAGAASVTIAVSDTGPGIAPEIEERLFHPFATTKVQGMGLGLTITRSIVEAHGGRLSFEPGLSSGVVFRLTLPRAE